MIEKSKSVWAHIGRIARKHGISALKVRGIQNHIHALTIAKRVNSPIQIAQWLKGESSKWIYDEFRHLKNCCWQDGYRVFSVSKSQAPDFIEYIKKQRQHRKKQSFDDEYVS